MNLFTAGIIAGEYGAADIVAELGLSQSFVPLGEAISCVLRASMGEAVFDIGISQGDLLGVSLSPSRLRRVFSLRYNNGFEQKQEWQVRGDTADPFLLTVYVFYCASPAGSPGLAEHFRTLSGAGFTLNSHLGWWIWQQNAVLE